MVQISWERVNRALAQFARQQGILSEKVLSIMRVLPQLLGLCGDVSRSRKTAYRIGCTLLSSPSVKLFVPVCPDYSHADGKYTFRHMGSGVSLLFLKHRAFVERLLAALPEMQIHVLLADHERDLQHLRGALRISDEVFEHNIQGTLQALRIVAPASWEVNTFTAAFPGFGAQVWVKAEALLRDPRHRHALVSDTKSRRHLYDKIGYPRRTKTRLMCTAHVAAQYVCLAEEAVRAQALICNHTTTSLRWYLQTSAGILHNPVSIY